MSNFPHIGSSPTPSYQATVATPPAKPLPPLPTQVSEPPRPQTEQPHVAEHQPQPLNPAEALQSIASNPSTPAEIQSRSEQLGSLKQDLAQTLGVVEHPHVDKTPPPQYNPQELQDKLRQHLTQHASLRVFSANIQQLDHTTDSLHQAQDQLKAIDETLEKTLQQLDKREHAYNAPLYRLASKLGIKSRTAKLAQLQALRADAIQTHDAQKRLHQGISEQDSRQLATLTGKVQEHTQQAKADGKQLVAAHLQDKAMMWNLSVQSTGQLRETMAQSLASELHGGKELLELYHQLSGDYTQRRDAFQEMKAQVTLYQNRIKNFGKEVRELEAHSPKEAAALKARFEKEQIQFEQTLIPLVEKTTSPDMLQRDAQGNLRLKVRALASAEFTDAPPKLYNIMPEQHQAYLNALVSGIQEALPNKITDDGSVLINGQKYINKTFLAEAGFAKVYTYTSESEPGKKIVVKVPHKPADMSEEAFQEKLQTESARELQNHYHAMGVDGSGHQNLVKLIGAIPTGQGPLIAMEFIDKGDCGKFANGITGKLAQRLKSHEITADEHRLINKHVLYQMMQGMQYMQDRGMTHMDVKYDNFLIHSDGTVKVADLGLSKTQAQFLAKKEDRGDNPIFLPPEVMSDTLRLFAGGREVSNKIDVWSVGIMSHEMLLGTRNRLDANFMSEIESNTAKFGYGLTQRMFENPQNATEVFLNRMLHADPKQRASFKELMQDPIFDELFEAGTGGVRGAYRPDVTQLVRRELNK